MHVKRLYTVILLFSFLVISTSPVVAQEGEHLVLAFYYAWFDLTTWQKPLEDYPLSPYHSADSTVIEQHIVHAQSAGIDALVQAWHGPERTNNQTEDNFCTLLDKALPYRMQVAVSVDLEAETFFQDTNVVINALRVLHDQHTPHPAYLRVDGAPVIFFWGQTRFSVSTWEAIRNQIDPERTMVWVANGANLEYLEIFDGLYIGDIARLDDPITALVEQGQAVRRWNAEHTKARYWIATVMPGYDALETGEKNTFVRDREDGAFYRRSWEGAIASKADWTVILSFNQWLEGTHIEPSVKYGDTYIRLTTELAERYSTSIFAPTPTASPTATPVPPTLTPTSSPMPTLVPPTATLTPTATLMPTVTLTPTATPFRLSTPTPSPEATSPPIADKTDPQQSSPTPSYVVQVSVTPTRPNFRPILVEGSAPKGCASLPAVFPLLLLFFAHRRRKWF